MWKINKLCNFNILKLNESSDSCSCVGLKTWQKCFCHLNVLYTNKLHFPESIHPFQGLSPDLSHDPLPLSCARLLITHTCLKSLLHFTSLHLKRFTHDGTKLLSLSVCMLLWLFIRTIVVPILSFQPTGRITLLLTFYF